MLTLVHELTADAQHRIVAIADDGTNSVGEWAPVQKLAHHLDLHANADPSNGLPSGIFKSKEVKHQVLT